MRRVVAALQVALDLGRSGFWHSLEPAAPPTQDDSFGRDFLAASNGWHSGPRIMPFATI